MANYKDIKGFHVQSLSSDPAASIAATGTWASAPNINTGRMELFGTGPGTAGMVVNGTPDGSDGAQVYDCEVYNGSAWTEVNNTDQRRQDGASAGVTTSALVTAGYTTSPRGNSAFTETFDGTNWSEETAINNGIQGRRGLGASESASLIVSAAPSNNCELWNGSSWTELNNQNTARSGQGTFGTSTAGIGSGGNPYRAIVESFDGTNWTEVGDLNTARQYLSGGGTQTAGLVFGGSEPPSTTKTEIFDGTSWTEVGDLSIAKYYGAGGGTQTSSIYAGGTPGTPAKQSSEEWSTASSLSKITEGQVYYNSSPTNAFKLTSYNIPGGTFSAGGNLNQKRYNINGCGTQTAGLVAGGDTYNDSPRDTADSETYNGTAWTEGNNLNENYQGSRQAGTSTAAVLVSANTPYATETYDGTSWSDNPSTLSSPRGGPGGLGGVLTAALYCGGYPSTGKVEEFNGSSWSEQTDMNTGRWTNACTGTSTAMMSTGGDTPPYSALTEIYNGTSWTEVGDQPIARAEMGLSGTSTVAVVAGGSGPPSIGPSGLSSGANSLVFWNGTSWALGPSGYPIQGRGNGGFGTAATGLFMGGIGTPNDTVTTTNEFDAGLGNLTITVS